MENFNQQQPRAKWPGWIVLVIAVVVAFAAAYVPFLLILAPALWAYAGARTKPVLMALPAAVFAAVMFTLDPAIVAGGLSGAALLVAILVEGFQESKEEEKRQLVRCLASGIHKNSGFLYFAI